MEKRLEFILDRIGDLFFGINNGDSEYETENSDYTLTSVFPTVEIMDEIKRII